MRYDVWAVVQDPGETNGMLPVVDELRKGGHSVRLLASGKALEILKGGAREYCEATSAESLAQSEAPKVLLTTTAFGGGVGRDLVPLLRGRSTIVLLQSLWSGFAGWKDPKYKPDHAITNDAVGLRTVRTIWSDMDETKVHMTGFPRLDAYASLDIRKESMEVRQLLGLDDRPIVLFAGQATPTGAMLDELVEVLNNIGGEDLYLFPRPHPRTRANYPSEMRPWQRALARFRGLLIVDWFRVCTLPQLVAAAAHCGAVVSMYSTVLLEAAAARGSAIAMLYPEALQAFRTENPGLEQFPLVELGCVAHAYDRSSLEDRLRAELWGQNSCRQRQELHICVDGQNACRAAEVIRTLI